MKPSALCAKKIAKPYYSGLSKVGIFPRSARSSGFQERAPVPARIELPQLRTMARHALPHLFEATLIPLALFYVALWYSGVWVALFAALSWSYLAIVRRILIGQRIPGLLVLGAVGLTVRTVVAMASGSVFVYFLQPSLTTVAVGGAFLLSVPAGRPLAQRLSADSRDVSARALPSRDRPPWRPSTVASSPCSSSSWRVCA